MSMETRELDPQVGPMVWLDGRLRAAGEARLVPSDRGFLLGAGVFETLRADRGHLPGFVWHYRRMAASAAAFGLDCPGLDELRECVFRVLTMNHLLAGWARIRISLSTGSAPPGQLLASADPTLLVEAHACAAPPSAPLRLQTVPWRRNEYGALAGHKSLSYAENLLALGWARRQGAEEALFLNTRGQVCEGATTNIWFVRDGLPHTPPDESGCLPGVARAMLLEMCRESGRPVVVAPVLPADILSADEVFVTSAIRRIQPVSALDGHDFSAVPGPVTSSLRAAFDAWLMSR